LPHTEVSREHATLQATDSEIFIVDKGSANGTFLNGKRVKGRETVRVGDAIRVGPYMVEVWAVPELPAPDFDPNRTQHSAIADGLSAFSGRFGTASPSEVLLKIEFHERSGTLAIADGQSRGWVAFTKGRPT